MQIEMQLDEWLGVDLVGVSQGSGSVAEPRRYASIYDRAAPSADWRAAKRRLGLQLFDHVVEPWQRAAGRAPVILALGAGQGIIEQPWLEAGIDVTLHECQERSLRDVRALYPQAGTMICDVRVLEVEAMFDIVTLLGIDYVLTEVELVDVLWRAARALRPGGLIVFQSVNVLSMRQLAIELARRVHRRRPHRPCVLWGWRRTPREFVRAARAAALAVDMAYISSSTGDLIARRFAALPPVRASSLVLILRTIDEAS